MPSINALNRQIQDEFAQTAAMASAPAPARAKKTAPALPEVALRRTGERPLAFKGREILSATSYSAGPSLWHQISLYQGESGLALDIRTYFKREDDRDVFFAAECASLEEAVYLIEQHDPASAIPVEAAIASDQLPSHEVALRAAMLRLRIDEARQQYRDLVGEILYSLATAA
jgi:hypothetical protein